MSNRQVRTPRTVRLVDFTREAMALDEETRAVRDLTSDAFHDAAHLQNLLMGYRAVVVWGRDADCPYPPGSARLVSWWQGADLARKDLSRPCKVTS